MANRAEAEVTLDPAVMADLRRLRTGRSVNLFQELLTAFQDEAPRLLASMRAGAREGSATQLKTAAHSLKGAAASLGAARLADLAGELEALGRAGSVAGADALLALLEPQLQRVADALLAEHQRRE